MKKSGKMMMGLLGLSVATVVGCSNEKPGVKESAIPTNEPVKLILFIGQPGALNMETLGITETLKKKFPHITLEVINKEAGKDYPDLIASGTLPDIIYESASFTVERIMANGFHYDLQELVKKHNFDLKRFEPNVLAQTQFANSEGKLYGLPFTMNKYALFYNKDIFDKFGQPYPKDGMTWDEVYALAQKLTRVDGADVFQGFTTTPNNMMLNNQLSLAPLNPKEDKATVNTDGWKILYENLKRFYEIPNASLIPATDFAKGRLAMSLDPLPSVVKIATENPQLKWDIAALPSLNERPKTGLKPATLALFVTQTSKHKDEAFQVVDYLVSEEVQTIISAKGTGTPLANDAVKKATGRDVPQLIGKNTAALYYYPDAPPSPPRAANLANVSVSFAASFADMIKNKTDVNTVLRQFEEEITKAIGTAKEANVKK